MSKDLVAYGIYPDRMAFERALDSLRAAGFRNSDVSAILPERDQTTRDLAHEINTKAPEGAATGAGHNNDADLGILICARHCIRKFVS